jgi:Rrf2 family protein
MKLSTRSRYGLKAVVDLAVYYGEGPVSLPTLASAQGISEGYLEQLLRELKKGGVVNTVRGAQGGYELMIDPAELSVQRVLSLLEGSTAVVDCVGTEPYGCKNACTCSARPLFLKLQSRINDVLAQTSIRDLADDYIQQKRRMLGQNAACD